jgi:hypothetical protein
MIITLKFDLNLYHLDQEKLLLKEVVGGRRTTHIVSLIFFWEIISKNFLDKN